MSRLKSRELDNISCLYLICYRYYIVNWQKRENSSGYEYKTIGEWKSGTLSMNDSDIFWRKGQMPKSVCSEECDIGYVKVCTEMVHGWSKPWSEFTIYNKCPVVSLKITLFLSSAGTDATEIHS